MAYVSGLTVSVMDIDSGEVISTAESGDGTHDWVQAALDHDGSVIAIERALERADDGVVVRSDARTTSLDDGAYEEHDVAAGRFMPIWVEGESLASAPAPGEHLRDANVDETGERSEEHTSELQSLMRISYAVFCLKKKKNNR